MKTDDKAQIQQLLNENEVLRARLEETEQIIRAIRHAEVDALVITGPQGEQVHTIETAERPYRLLVQHARDFAIVTLDLDGRYNSWNEGAEEMLGYTEAEVLGQPSALIFTPEDRQRGVPEQEMQTALTEGRAEDERYHLRKDGTRFYSSGVMTPFYNAHGTFLGFAKIMRDLTERKQAEEALRRSEERYRLTIDIVTDYAIFNLDPHGRVTSWNEGAKRIKGYETDEILGEHFRVFYTEDDQQDHKPERELAQAAATGRNEDQSWRIRKDGTLFWADEIVTALRSVEGTLLGFVKITRDLTERKRAEEERAILMRETTLLVERNRMARELHDSLAQGFTGIKLQMEVAEELLGKESEQARECILRARQIAQQSLLDARRSIQALRPQALEGTSLSDAIQRLAEEATGRTKIQFVSEGTSRVLFKNVESDLYRIAQEALTNAVRHAEAQCIEVRLTYLPHQVRLRIQDDGRGFDPAAERTGFGLTGMQERAANLGAELRLTSKPGQGTEILLTLPIPNPFSHALL